jgi:Flagellar assembly protein FliH
MARPAPHFSAPREFRVSFADRLAGAVMVDTHTPLPPLRKPPADLTDTPVHIDNSPRPAAPPTDTLLAEIGMQLASDRRAIETVLGSLTAAVGRVQADPSALLGACRKLAVELATNIAAKLLHERISADQFNLEQMVRDMAADMPEDEVVCVRLNPRDLELLEKRLDGQPLLSGPTDPQLIADHTLARGECRVEGRATVSLSDLPRQLGIIREDLLRRIADAGA